jgi:hypothetical protein
MKKPAEKAVQQAQNFQNCGIFPSCCPLEGGDKPRHYKRKPGEQVGAGFIPARKLTCLPDDCRRQSCPDLVFK